MQKHAKCDSLWLTYESTILTGRVQNHTIRDRDWSHTSRYRGWNHTIDYRRWNHAIRNRVQSHTIRDRVLKHTIGDRLARCLTLHRRLLLLDGRRWMLNEITFPIIANFKQFQIHSVHPKFGHGGAFVAKLWRDFVFSFSFTRRFCRRDSIVFRIVVNNRCRCFDVIDGEMLDFKLILFIISVWGVFTMRYNRSDFIVIRMMNAYTCVLKSKCLVVRISLMPLLHYPNLAPYRPNECKHTWFGIGAKAHATGSFFAQKIASSCRIKVVHTDNSIWSNLLSSYDEIPGLLLLPRRRPAEPTFSTI